MSNSEWIEREKAVLSPASHRPHDPKFGPVFCRGNGGRLWDTQGNEYLDLTCGYSVTNFGHAFPPLIAAATAQLAQLSHLTQEPHELRSELAEQLLEAMGSGKVHFNATGARAIETAWKAAIAFRPGRLISIAPSYHGRSLATGPLSDTKWSLADFVPKSMHERRPRDEYAYCANCPLELEPSSCNTACQDRLIDTIERDASQISAILVEPALGARGYLFPPAAYWQRLRRATERHGILLIADEIQMGLGRCGAMSLSRSQGWQPDLIVLGKSLGGGIAAISAVVGRREVIDALPVGSESETFACTPLAAAVALEVLRQLRDGPWIARGLEIGRRLREGLGKLLRAATEITSATSPLHRATVEGVGACAVIEFVRLGDAAQSLARRFAEVCFDERLLVHFTGPLETRIALIPPFTLTDEEIDTILQRFQRVCERVAAAS